MSQWQVITGVVLVASVIGFMFVTVLPDIRDMPSGLKEVVCSLPYVDRLCADEAATNYFIVDFSVVPGIGVIEEGEVKTTASVSWTLLDVDEIEYINVSHNTSADNREPLLKSGLNAGNKVVTLPDFDARTFTLEVYGEEGLLESKSLFVDFRKGLDRNSLNDFLKLNEIVQRQEIEVNPYPEMTAPYHIHEDLVVVGFNKGRDTVEEQCGKVDVYQKPEECDSNSCLCLCKAESVCLHSQRICFAYDDIDYFISRKGKGDDYLNRGLIIEGITLGGNPVNSLVFLGNCGGLDFLAELGLDPNDWPTEGKSLFVSKKIYSGKSGDIVFGRIMEAFVG